LANGTAITTKCIEVVWSEQKDEPVQEGAPFFRAADDQLAIGTCDREHRQNRKVSLGRNLYPIDEQPPFRGRSDLEDLFDRACQSSGTELGP
jgi:hypothetical protein